MTSTRTVYLIVCAASPAADAIVFIEHATASAWDCHVIGTPAARKFLDIDAIETSSGNKVTFDHRRPNEAKRGRPPADMAVIAPATANTINRLAAGIGGNYALDVASELIGANVPITIVPFVNTMLANRKPFQTALHSLKQEGVHVLIEHEGSRPHSPRKGPEHRAVFPWKEALRDYSQT
ncbi:flavoprotein [Natronoglycomyces albus]|uniref:Flavoprotein n=1 Tax=Natronoglycomyces albus TaxID=2811108 RepID=A0A895XSN3_9ACTN|nr:flavoprotein [Natronoglycomyces albus]QSB06513.1 flavoprotein [Natronoglycomyces albus]